MTNHFTWIKVLFWHFLKLIFVLTGSVMMPQFSFSEFVPADVYALQISIRVFLFFYIQTIVTWQRFYESLPSLGASSTQSCPFLLIFTE